MAAGIRKVFACSKFEFSDTAVEAIRKKFQNKIHGKAPFVAYDKDAHLFSTECNRGDEDTPATLFICMREFIEEQQEASIFEVPSINPQPGTVIEDQLNSTAPNVGAQADEESSALLDLSANHAPEGIGSAEAVLTQFWPDREGKQLVKATPWIILRDIANVTGCHITEEPDNNRWRIDGANAHSAFARLEHLRNAIEWLREPMQANALIVGYVIGEHRIQVQHLTASELALKRVILPQEEEADAEGKLPALTQLRVLNPDTEELFLPPNLEKQQPVNKEFKRSSLWEGRKYDQVGLPYEDLLQPRTEVARDGDLLSLDGEKQGRSGKNIRLQTRPATPQQQSYQKVDQWRRQVEPTGTTSQVGGPASQAGSSKTAPSHVESAHTVPSSFDELLQGAGPKLQTEDVAHKPAKTFDELLGLSQPKVLGRVIAPADTASPATERIQSLSGVQTLLQQVQPRPEVHNKSPVHATSVFGPSSYHQTSRDETSTRHRNDNRPPFTAQTASRGAPAIGAASFAGAYNGPAARHSPSYARAASHRPVARRAVSRPQQPHIPKTLLQDIPRQENRVPSGAPWGSHGATADLLTADFDEPFPPLGRRQRSTTPLTEPFRAAASDVGTSISQRSQFPTQFYVNTENPGMDITAMRRAVIEKIAKERQDSVANKDVLQQIDEVSTRKVHNLMNQKAARKSEKKTTEADRRKKIDDAWGPRPSAPQPASTVTHKPSQIEAPNVQQGTNRASGWQPKVSGLTREERIQNEEISNQTQTIRQTLVQTLTAVRPLRAWLDFEIKLGQVVTLQPKDRAVSQYFTVRQWKDKFTSKNLSLAPRSLFAAVLTRNGAEIDNLLNPSTGVGPKIFEWAPFERRVLYEFHCQTAGADKFIINMEEDGNFVLSQPQQQLSMTRIHFVGQIWDASMNMSVAFEFSANDTIMRAVQMFVGGIYVKQDNDLKILFRTNEEFECLKVVAKRISYHHTVVLGREDVIGKVTEVQLLDLTYQDDSMICRARGVKGNDAIERETRLHYEMSLQSAMVKEKLASNKDLEMGKPNSTWEETSLATHKRVNDLLSVTSTTVKAMNGLGSQNYSHLHPLRSATGGNTYRSAIGPRSEATLGPDDSATAVGLRLALGDDPYQFW